MLLPLFFSPAVRWISTELSPMVPVVQACLEKFETEIEECDRSASELVAAFLTGQMLGSPVVCCCCWRRQRDRGPSRGGRETTRR